MIRSWTTWLHPTPFDPPIKIMASAPLPRCRSCVGASVPHPATILSQFKSRTAGGDLLPPQFEILADKGGSMQGVGAMDRCAIVQQQVDRGKMSIVDSPRERYRVPSSFVCVDVSSSRSINDCMSQSLPSFAA
jgi:hypothetical protein